MRLLPRSLLGQIALLILGAFLAAQVISLWLFADERGAAIRAAQRLATVEQAAAVADALVSSPPSSRAGILAAATSRNVRFGLDPVPLVPPGPGVRTTADGIRIAEIARLRHGDKRAPPGSDADRPPARDHATRMAAVELRLSVPLERGDWLNVTARFLRPEVQPTPAIFGATLLSLVLILVALWVGLRRITTPLSQLAAAADTVGPDGALPAIPTGGPREVRALSDALVRMNGRLAGMIADRTRMLAALGHDLRSPITALRLRAEMVDDAETRDRMIATLDEMQEMVETTLAFARGVSTDQPTEDADLSDLLRDLVREVSETGPAIALDAPHPVIAPIRRTPVRRALRNLLENAQRYGGGGRVTVRAAGGMADIVIDDDGPGIPEADLDRVFDPFTRLETSRSRDTGGIGLGLPIARAILRAHGGDVGLTNRTEGGLRATARLPMTAAPRREPATGRSAP